MNTHALLDRVPCVSSVWLCLSALGSAVLVGGVSLQPTGPGVIPAAVRGRAPQQNDSPAWFSRTLTPPSTSLPPIVGHNGEPGHRTGARVSCRPAECDTEFVWPPSARVSQRLRSLWFWAYCIMRLIRWLRVRFTPSYALWEALAWESFWLAMR